MNLRVEMCAIFELWGELCREELQSAGVTLGGNGMELLSYQLVTDTCWYYPIRGSTVLQTLK